MRVSTWGGIGDVLLLTPALRSIKRQRPGSRLEVVCEGQSHLELLQHNPYIDLLQLNQKGPLRQFYVAQLQSVRGLLKIKPSLIGTDYGRLRPSLQPNKHAAELIAEILKVELDERKLDVFLTEAEENRARAILEPYKNPVAIHVTSQCSKNQNWPLENWEQLVKRNPRYTFVQIGTLEEAQVAGAVDLRGKTSLRESIAVLKHCRGFVGVVSSMAHATNAVDTPGVVLFGPSAPEVWGHSNIKVVTKKLRCAPCIDFLKGVECPYGAPCMSEITVEEVEESLHEQITHLAKSAP